jgi:hypothetical protein
MPGIGLSTSSQNSDLLRDLCHTLCETRKTFFVLHFVLLTQTHQFAMHVELEVFLEISPI